MVNYALRVPQGQVGPYFAQSQQACVSALTLPAQPRPQQPTLPLPIPPQPYGPPIEATLRGFLEPSLMPLPPLSSKVQVIKYSILAKGLGPLPPPNTSPILGPLLTCGLTLAQACKVDTRGCEGH